MSRGCIASVLLSAGLLFTPAPAQAQPASAATKAAAQALFDDARRLTAANDFEAACPKLAESHRLDPTVGTKFYLADCLEHIGKLASAWTYYIEAADLAKAKGQKQRETFARDRAEAVKQRLSTIAITVPDSVRALPGLALKRNGIQVGEAQWGTAVPVDPGEHVISATADGYEPWETRLVIQEEHEIITVEVPSLATREEPAEPVVPKPQPPPPPRPLPPPKPPAPGRGKAQRIAGIAVGSAGVAGVAVGAAFGGLALSKQNASNADGHCDAANFCDDTGLSLRREAITAATVSTVGFIAGGALTAAGVILVWTAPSATPQAGSASGGMTLAIAARPSGIGITGRW